MSAQKAYEECLTSVRNQITELQMHFAAAGKKDANWGDHGDLMRTEVALREITDRLFQRGEFSE